MLASYISSTEKALSEVSIVDTKDIRVLQAFLIYLEAVGQHYGLRSVWIMTGLLSRAAVSMGLHRDGSNFSNISYFETEMRRRLWWHICFLDFRMGQCDLPEMMIPDASFDTKEPTNLNDDDIDPLMTQMPVPREGLTDVSFTLLNCVLRRQSQRILSVMSLFAKNSDGLLETQAEVLKCLKNSRKEIHSGILQSPDPKKPVHHFIGFVAELSLQHYTIVVKHMNIFGHLAPTSNEPPRQQSFVASMACLENKYAWKVHPSTRQWTWVLQIFFIQWHAIGIILVHLRTQPWGPTCERAWNLAIEALDAVPSHIKKKNPMGQSLWDMLAAARQHREEELRRLRKNPTILRDLDRFSKIQETFSPADGPATGTFSFDTSVVEKRLARETAVSLGESDTTGDPHCPYSQGLVEDNGSTRKGPTGDQFYCPCDGPENILTGLSDLTESGREPPCFQQQNAEPIGNPWSGYTGDRDMDIPVEYGDLFANCRGSEVDIDSMARLFNDDPVGASSLLS